MVNCCIDFKLIFFDLINVMDTFKPDFSWVIRPGYVG